MMDKTDIGTPTAPLNLPALAAAHNIPVTHLDVFEVGVGVYKQTQAFLHTVAAGEPAQHPITGELHTPAAVAIEPAVAEVLYDPIVPDLPVTPVDAPVGGWGDVDERPERDTTEVKIKHKKGRPYAEQYVALPRDLVQTFKKCHGYTPAPKDAPKDSPWANARRADSKAGKGRTADRFQVRDFYLAAALYRMAPNPTKDTDPDKPLLVIVEPSALAAATTWSVSSLRDGFNSDTPVLGDYVRKVPGTHYNAAGRVVWKFELQPVPTDSFLKVPAWWLWKEPVAGKTGAERWVKSCDWSKSSAALLVALTYLHVTDYDTNTNDQYGKAGLATVCGTSPATIKAGRRDAIRYGFITTDNCTGGNSNAKVTVCLVPATVESVAINDGTADQAAGAQAA